MAHIVEDRILESTTTTGTGALALAAAITGFRRFNTVCAVGDTVPYFAEAIDSLGQPTGDYEYGIGTYSAANQLTRTMVLGSSNGGAVVDFTAGAKNVGITLTKREMDYRTRPGFRNRLMNGNFSVNQRGVAGAVVLAAGAYGHDRWKAGAGGCSYTFATAGAHTVITITAGSLMQVIEDKNVEGGVYALSNQGTAQARIAVNGAATAGAYAAATSTSPLLSASATGGQAMTVEFSTGTVDRAQIESGTVATPWEHRPASAELAMCQRYYETGKLFMGGAYPTGGAGASAYAEAFFKVTKRVVPFMTQLPASTSSNVSANAFSTADTNSCAVSATQGPAVGNFSLSLYWSATAEL